MRFDLLHPADQIVMIMQRIYAYGMTTTSGGNLSIRDEDGDVWITPAGVDKGSLARRDVIRVRPDGTAEGPHRPSSELPFHLSIYGRRKDLRAILHAHPPALVAFSIVRRAPETHLVPNVDEICGPVAYAEYALPGSARLGENIAAVFARGIDTVLLENHGVVLGAADLFRAFMAFETLDFCARLEIGARRMATPRPLTPDQLALTAPRRRQAVPTFVPGPASGEERTARREICELVHRAYDQQLVTSTQGTFSRRLAGDDFVITPFGLDRKYLEPADLVRVEGGRAEAGKTPSRSVHLHRRIYERQPAVDAVIIAHPPSAMVFAVTDLPLDSRTIPESYILLRDVPRLPFGTNLVDVERAAQTLSPRHPVVVLENDSLMFAGNTLLNAFDRLEVAEYSARAILAARDLGEIVAIPEAHVRELVEAFSLER
jgi:L-fuculose-phosphate aldolase